MRVLFVGYDLSYVQFYSAIELELRKRLGLSSLHIYLRPSAWLYARLILRLTAISPSVVRLVGRWPFLSIIDGKLLDLIFYPAATNANQRGKLERLYAAYYYFLRESLSNREYDVAVLPGEFRLFEQATISVLNSAKKPPTVIFFEAGPPGYVYLDKNGVNANASFTITGVSKLVVNMRSQALVTTKPPVAISNVIRIGLLALDVAWLWLAKRTRGLLDLEEFWVATCNRLRVKFATKNHAFSQLQTLPIARYIIFVGQVRNDVNHTHFGVSDVQLEQHLLDLLASDLSLTLIWRDHPLESSDNFYNRVSSAYPSRVVRMEKMSLQQLLASAEGVVTVNSNGGLEALAFGLPVRLLGRSYFARINGVCLDDITFQIFRNKIRESGPDESIKADAEKFMRSCFLPIDYRNGDFRNAHLAAEVIISCVK